MKILVATLLLTYLSTTMCKKVDIDKFLVDFGYMDEEKISPDGTSSRSPEDREKAVRFFQKMLNLPVTGQLDPITVKKMSGRRCGIKDLIPPRDRKRTAPGGPMPFYAIGLYVRSTAKVIYGREKLRKKEKPGTKWDKSRLTYKFTRFTNQLSQALQRRAIRNALGKWSAVTNLDFQEVSSNNADILIDYGSGYHGDDYPFDNRGGTLAHAFFPGGSAISGDTHFDQSEKWTMDTSEGTNLEIVAAHEFGHALGLSHSNVQGALMAPFYAGYDPNYKLHIDDIQGIQSLYGIRRSRPRVTTTRRPPPRTPTTRRPRPPKPKPKPRPDLCRTKFDAIFNSPDRRVYAMRGTKLYKFETDVNGIEQARYVRRTFRRSPKNVGAVVMDRYGRLFMFKGKRYWRYNSRGQLDKGYPKVIKGVNNFFRKAQAAVSTRNGQIYLLKGDKVSPWREDFVTPPRGYPIPISRIFPGAPRNVEAAIRWNNYIYFFKGMNYFKFDERYRRMVRGYPKPKAAAWLGCGRPLPK